MIRLLLDSHVLIWYDKQERLSAAATEIIRTAAEVCVSAASFWELTIKSAHSGASLHDGLLEAARRHRFRVLSITAEHGIAAGQLPLHHRDPFDRMLVAQAQLEQLTLVTHDRTLQQYGVPLLLV